MVIGDIERPDGAILEDLRSVSANDLGHHFHFGFPDAAIRYLGSNSPVSVVGPVVTARIPPEDSVMVHKVTEVAEPGDVVVVDMQGHTEHAPWGEMTTRAAMASGVEAAVIDGSITDSRDIEELGFDVYARGRSARTTRLHGRGGDINVPVQVGGASVRPGDIALGNEDGVLFLPPEAAEHAIELGTEAIEGEEAVVERIEDGESLADITAANEMLAEMGEVDE